jgi:hypothetical protein
MKTGITTYATTASVHYVKNYATLKTQKKLLQSSSRKVISLQFDMQPFKKSGVKPKNSCLLIIYGVRMNADSQQNCVTMVGLVDKDLERLCKEAVLA